VCSTPRQDRCSPHMRLFSSLATSLSHERLETEIQSPRKPSVVERSGWARDEGVIRCYKTHSETGLLTVEFGIDSVLEQ
jgi:hypothetical protein